MNKVFLDTNVLIDYLLNRGDMGQYATLLLQLANSGIIDLIITDLTVANIAYITRKDIPLEEFYRVMKILRKYITVVSIGQDVIDRALDAQWKDFEDSLQYFAAEKEASCCIVTRNIKDFSEAEIPVVTSKQFVESLGQE